MNIELFVTQKRSYDLDNLTSLEQIELVSFDLHVLDRYHNHNDFKIELDDGVGSLEDQHGLMKLPIDVNEACGCLTTFLYCLNVLPRVELKHFTHHNIYPHELSERARALWVRGD